MPLVECEFCGKYWTHSGFGPIEDHCKSNGNRPGEYILVYGHPIETSRL